MNWADDDVTGYEATDYDYRSEAFGDPCPNHGTLRFGGDCPKCEDEWRNSDPEAA